MYCEVGGVVPGWRRGLGERFLDFVKNGPHIFMDFFGFRGRGNVLSGNHHAGII